MNPATLGSPGERPTPFRLQGISDEYLEQVYAASTCLIAASINEGFGLPLIEAARHGIPIVARDIRRVTTPLTPAETGPASVCVPTPSQPEQNQSLSGNRPH